MNWTDEQQRTIETMGTSILVSAAAGSGKTTVLVERIRKLMIEQGTDIDRFLITTFTNAAAAEMKERLGEALRKEMEKPGADRAMLASQLSKLPAASIGTFHSFALEIIRQYFYLIDLEPGFSIADDVQISIMKKKAVDNVFAARYEENTEAFRNFVLQYGGGRNDSRLRENLLETCKTLGSIHHGVSWARAKASKLGSEDVLTETGAYRYFADKILDCLAEAVRSYRLSADLACKWGLMNCYDTALDDVDQLTVIHGRAIVDFACPEEELREAIAGFEDVLSGFSAGSMSFKKDNAGEDEKDRISAARKAGKDALDTIRKDVYGRSFDEIAEELRGLHDDTMYYIGLIEEYEAELKQMKAEKKVIEFDDALHYAIDILENEEAAEELRERFEYIFVDEYQDSNYLQEEIVERIARDDNLFMVGDIKQCIYKFRLSEPELFRKRAIDFAEEDTNGQLLHISSNFRSKRNVTDAVNCVFGRIMDGYDDAARLNCTAGDEHLGFPPRIHLIVNEGFDEYAPEKNDAEGAVIAGIIAERLGTEVFDTKTGRMRPLQLRDFAVIVRNNKEVEDIERYLLNEGIAAYGESGGGFFETVEVQVFINLLRIIENMRQDVPLISAMRSVVFGFTVPELAQIRIACRDGSFSDAVLEYAAGGPDEGLREKILAMIRRVDLWKEISRTVPLEDLMKEILYGTGYYDYCSGLPVGNQRISNLRLIADKASRFEEMSHSGLYGFLRYIESMQESDKTDSEAKVISEGEDVVRVMSVHKSKGLEFPVVIFANASKQTEKGDRSGRIKIHRDHGIGLPVVNREEHWHRTSLLQKMILDTSRNESIEEEIRILYVALTRAKDGLEIVGTVKNTDRLEQETTTKTFLEMMFLPLSEMEGTEVIVYDDADALTTRARNRAHTAAQLDTLAGALDDPDLAAFAADRLSFVYPYASDVVVKPKYTVTELNRAGIGVSGGAAGGADDGAAGDAVAVVDGGAEIAAGAELPIVEAFDPDAARRRGGRGAMAAGDLTAAERGTLMHLLMEKADFARATDGAGSGTGSDGGAAVGEGSSAEAGSGTIIAARELLQETADRLLADDILTIEEYDALSIDKAAAFFDSDIGQRAAAAAERGTLRKEKEFIYSMDMAEGETTIVQGVIDCYFEEEDGLVLIDYKNSYMGAGRSEDDVRKTYAGQIDLYRQALEGATGKPVKEAYLYLFDTARFIQM